jgi:hypothetical protein
MARKGNPISVRRDLNRSSDYNLKGVLVWEFVIGSIPFMKKIPKKLWDLFLFFLLLTLFKGALSLGYLWMDELHAAFPRQGERVGLSDHNPAPPAEKVLSFQSLMTKSLK